MPISHVFLVHGYSVRSLSAYAQFPTFLSARYAATNIFLSAFNSLDDAITCDDLAAALEDHISALEASSRIDIASTAFICHSTGAIVTRRWILNRLATDKPMPSHFVSVAGANHGSTLAQLGETMAAYVFRQLSGGTAVGRGVLTDLDYGSDFLLALNEQWLDAVNGPLSGLYAFSMGGDAIGDWAREIIWQTKEPGSDSTVRISGANLNYSILQADADARILEVKIQRRQVPHLVLHGYSHTGAVGIIDSVRAQTDAPFAAVLQSLTVETPVQYETVRQQWAQTTAAWITQNANTANVASTIVFHLADQADRPVNDSFILLQDRASDPTAVSGSLIDKPIQNDAVHASVAFYVNEPQFQNSAPHQVAIQARSGSVEIDYKDVTYTIGPDVGRLVEPNETTYVFVRVKRDTDSAYALYGYAPNLPLAPPWPPFPPGSIPLIAPRPAADQ